MSGPYSPLVKRMCENRGIDPDTIEGTGPGGRVTRQDVLRMSDVWRNDVPEEAAVNNGEIEVKAYSDIVVRTSKKTLTFGSYIANVIYSEVKPTFTVSVTRSKRTSVAKLGPFPIDKEEAVFEWLGLLLKTHAKLDDLVTDPELKTGRKKSGYIEPDNEAAF